MKFDRAKFTDEQLVDIAGKVRLAVSAQATLWDRLNDIESIVDLEVTERDIDLLTFGVDDPEEAGGIDDETILDHLSDVLNGRDSDGGD